jgi:hypothetical protein
MNSPFATGTMRSRHQQFDAIPFSSAARSRRACAIAPGIGPNLSSARPCLDKDPRRASGSDCCRDDQAPNDEGRALNHRLHPPGRAATILARGKGSRLRELRRPGGILFTDCGAGDAHSGCACVVGVHWERSGGEPGRVIDRWMRLGMRPRRAAA